MNLSRRASLGLVSMIGAPWIIGGTAAGWASTGTLAGGSDTATDDAAVGLLRQQIVGDLAARGLPGATVALVYPDGRMRSFAVGYSNADSRQPVAPDMLFEIGSISKSLVAVAIHVLIDRGQLRLDDPVARLLPDVPLPDAPITIQHLLDHSSGLPNAAPVFPDVPAASLWVGAAPGARFSYSNTGYMLLGLILERVTQQRFAIALNRLVLEPLGMADSKAVIRMSDRARYAVGHVLYAAERPPLPDARLAPGPWVEIDDPAGSVAATAADMALYLRFIAGLAKGKGAPLMSDRTARLFGRLGFAAPEYSPEARYGNGFIHRAIDGRPSLEHTGGMIAFTSCATIDRESGAACFVGVNAASGGYRPRALSRLGVRLLVAQASGRPSAVTPLADPFAIAGSGNMVGRYRGQEAASIEIQSAGDRLTLQAFGQSGRLFQASAGRLATDHPQLSGGLIEFEPGDAGHRAFWWRETYFTQSPDVRADMADERLRPMAGSYVSNDPWVDGVNVFVRGGSLWIEGSGRIDRHGEDGWRFADPDSFAERVDFDRPVNGRHMRLRLSGNALRRCADRFPEGPQPG